MANLDPSPIAGNAFKLWNRDGNEKLSREARKRGADLWYPDDADGNGDSVAAGAIARPPPAPHGLTSVSRWTRSQRISRSRESARTVSRPGPQFTVSTLPLAASMTSFPDSP